MKLLSWSISKGYCSVNQVYGLPGLLFWEQNTSNHNTGAVSTASASLVPLTLSSSTYRSFCPEDPLGKVILPFPSTTPAERPSQFWKGSQQGPAVSTHTLETKKYLWKCSWSFNNPQHKWTQHVGAWPPQWILQSHMSCRAGHDFQWMTLKSRTCQ